MIIAVLTLLGLCLGSFVNALVYRLHWQENHPKKAKQASKYSIIKGRSLCPNCKHELAAKDLLPVISWLQLRGRCRYCKKPISWQYPSVELLTAGLFVLSYVFWANSLSQPEQVIGFLVWLVCLVGFVSLTLYDIKYQILPNKIIFPLIFVAMFGIAFEAILTESFQPINSATLGALVGGGLFYALFQISNGSWIGGGDVKLGFLLGLLMGGAWMALFMLFLASLLGTLYSTPLMLTGKLQAKARIPFGPFLIAAAVIVKLFGADIQDWYLTLYVV